MYKYRTREERVREFHNLFNCMLDVKLADGNKGIDQLDARRRLIIEESKEVKQAIDDMKVKLVFGEQPSDEDWAHLLKELTDLQYVISGTLIAFEKLSNIDFDVAFNRTHYSNMSKLGVDGKPEYTSTGKVKKGPNYYDPDYKDLF